MENIEIKSKTIMLKDLWNFNEFIKIPRYQRPYTWNKREVQALIEDIKNSSMNSYYIGTIHIFENNNNNNKELLDGQQRMTTIFLILYFLENKNLLTDELKKAYKIKEKWRIVFENKSFISNMNMIERNQINNTIDRNFYDSYQIIEKELGKMIESKIIEKYIKKITSLSFTYIIFSNYINPHVIFNSLNNRGISLGMSDVIKNILLSSSSDSDPDKLLSKWKLFGEEVNNLNLKKPNIYDFVLMEYYMSEKGETKHKAIKNLEKEFNIFNYTHNKNVNPNEKELNEIELKEKELKEKELKFIQANKIIDNYIVFASNLKYAYVKDLNILEKISNIKQNERLKNMWEISFHKTKMIQIKSLANKLITFYKYEDKKLLFKALYYIYIIDLWFKISGKKTNLFESNIKKKIYNDSNLSSLNKRLVSFITKNEMIDEIFDDIEEKTKEWKNSNTFGKKIIDRNYERTIRKQLIFMTELSKKEFKNNINQFNFEHPHGKAKSINDFFLIEEWINSSVVDKNDEDKNKLYKSSVLSFPKKIKLDIVKNFNAEEIEWYKTKAKEICK